MNKWLNAFQLAVRTGDPEAGRHLFADGVVSFGTRTNLASGIDELVSLQWHQIWDQSKGFELTPVLERAIGGGKLLLCHFVNQTWNGEIYVERSGRATFVLEQDATGQWLCIHSHFSEMV